MAVYCVNIDQAVTTWNRFTRYVEAESEEDALAKAAEIAAAQDEDGPEDSGPGNFDEELGPWEANDAHLSSEEEADSVGAEIIGREPAEDDED